MMRTSFENPSATVINFARCACIAALSVDEQFIDRYLDEVVAARVSLVRAACADSESRGLAIKKFLCSAALRLIPSSPKPDSRANRRR